MERHLNCFYTYNHSNELIENNLTRAFIITLGCLSEKLRNTFLHSVNSDLYSFDFQKACFALQSNIDKNSNYFKNKFIITISDDLDFNCEDVFLKIGKDAVKLTLNKKPVPLGVGRYKNILSEITYGSIPDAWIYDADYNYCFLVECKVHEKIYFPQIIRHAFQNFRIDDLDIINSIIIRMSWYEILSEFSSIYKYDQLLDRHEQFIIENFVEYFSFFEFKHFEGFSFSKLFPQPNFSFEISGLQEEHVPISNEKDLFNFNAIKRPPKFNFNFQKATQNG